MAIGKITGTMLQANLERQGTNISIDAAAYFDVTNYRLGVNNNSPQYTLDISGNAHLGNLYILGNTITTDSGKKLNLGNIANIAITGGVTGYVIGTDGTGNLAFINPTTLSADFVANAIPLGSNVSGQLVSNAVSLTSSTDVTDAIAQMNSILGKLVPSSPPSFPTSTLGYGTATYGGLMCNFTQTDNSGWGNLSVAGGTSVNATRVSTLALAGITNNGTTASGGNIQLYVNGVIPSNSYHQFSSPPSSGDNGTYGQITITNTEDYHVVSSGVSAGFWYVFSVSSSLTGVPSGWNRANLYYTGDATGTNNVVWYYDASAPGVPTFSNTSITLTSNNVTYSSTIPHLNTSSVFTLKGNVAVLSGNTYPNSTNLFSSTAGGGAINAPSNITYAAAGITTPLAQNLYVSSGSAYFQTTCSVVSGFGVSSSGPSVTVNNNYYSASNTFAPGVNVLYNNGTTQILETAITNSFTGASAAYRIVNPDAGTAADNPAYTGSEATFNSTTGTFYATDATVVASSLKYDVTNYSTGYLPVGPNLSTRGGGAQYFTFKWTKAAVSKFNIAWTGSIAGLWVALPGSSIDTTASPTNGWINMAVAYAGSGVPGTGSGGNGSAGCSTGGTATLNTNGSYSVTCTFGTVSSTSATNNEIYIRIKLTSGQSVSVLSIANPTN